jgi:hypothetical protein
MDLLRSLSWISSSHLRLVRDDDSQIDRLSHRYTVAICILFAVIVTTKQYAGDPIDCWVPAQFKASYEKYADSYCWIAGSWYTPMDKELPLSERERRQNRIRYYQWVPFLLLFQAILCYIPRIIWRSFNVRSGLDMINLVDAAIKYENVDKFNDRDKIMAYIVRNVERYIGARKSRYERLYGRQYCAVHKEINVKSKRNQSPIISCCKAFWLRARILFSTVCFWTGKRLGNYLVVLYMFVKTLWLTNAISQLFLLNRFIGNDYHAFGIEIIQMLLSGQEWHELRHFPRVTYCDFKIREIGNSHDWTVQCVLRINLFNEVIYIFMWFWLCMLAFFSAIDYISWTFRILIPYDKLRFVKRHIDVFNFHSIANRNKQKMGNEEFSMKSDLNDVQDQLYHQSANNTKRSAKPDFEYVDVEKEKRLMKEFTFKYLKDDGIFAMRILASSASDLIVTEIISELWKSFKSNYVESPDEMTLLSSPLSSHSSSSTSSSSSSSGNMSAASSPSSTINSSISKQANGSPQSPSNMMKKPVGFITNPKQYTSNNTPLNSANTKSGQSVSFSNPLTNYNNSNPNRISPNSQSIPPTIPPPPLPIQTPSLYSNTNPDENKRPIASNGQTNKDQAIYPQIQQRHFHVDNSNVNPSSKDTHV